MLCPVFKLGCRSSFYSLYTSPLSNICVINIFPQSMAVCFLASIYLFFLRFHLFIFREGGGKEKERERNISVWLHLACPPLDTWPTCNPGMCPDWESNQRPLGSQPALNPLSHTNQDPILTLCYSSTSFG